MSKTPTQNSLERMRKQGYFCWITEHYNYFAKKRQDLFGFIDILCLRGQEIIGLQTTSYSNISARVKKIRGYENLKVVLAAGIKIVVHGWRKVGTRWECKEVEVKDGE